MVKFIILFYLMALTSTAVAQTPVFSFNSSWKYLDNGSNQGTAWRAVSFAETNWKTGVGKFGYGILDATTPISFGTSAKRKFITTYFRKTISVQDPTQYASFTGQVKRDDGVVVYVNGTEVYRNNMPTGAISYTTLAAGASDNGTAIATFPVSPTAFVNGTNVIAVEVHQQKANTSDMAFDLALIATLKTSSGDVTPPSVVSINRQAPLTLTAPFGLVTFRATFNEPVTGVTVDDFLTTTTNSTTGTVSSVLPLSGSTYDISVNTTGEGTLRLDLKGTGTGINDIAGNALAAGFTSGQSYTIQSALPVDTTPPTVLSISRQNPLTETTNATSLTFRASFSEPVTGVDISDFSVTTTSGTVNGSFGSNAVAAVGTQGALYDITFSSITGTGVLRLDLKEGASVNDAAGNPIANGFSGGQTYSVSPPPVTPLPGLPVTLKSTWKYLDNGTDQGTAWRTSTFDDSQWKSGNGQFGYGDGDESTILNYGPNTSSKYITYYFRKSITIPTDVAYTSYNLKLVRDDGAVVYVNGTEVFRSNMPTGTVSYTTLAATSNEATISFTLPATAFRAGVNVIAVEVHQNYASSSDISFDLEVIGSGGTTTPQVPVLVRGPFLQKGSQTAMSVKWRTDIATESKVEVGTLLGNYPIEKSSTAKTTDHEVRVEGLLPQTKYYYRIGNTTHILQTGASNFFHTAPADTSKAKIRVAIFGDCGKDSNGNRTGTLNSYLNYTGNNPAELLLLLGDNAYEDGTEADYQKEFFAPYGGNILRNHVLFPAPGNHDYHLVPLTSRDQSGYYTSFSMPTQGESGGIPSNTKAYYSFDWGNIHFVSLDSYGIEPADNTKLYDTTGVQVQWLKRDLEANTKKWTILYWHHPPHSMGSHNSDTEGDMRRLRDNFIRIIERYGVDLVFTGHSHDYERSYLLDRFYGPELTFDPAVHTKSTSSAQYDGSANSCPYVTTSGTGNHGTVYVVAGSAGNSGTVEPGYPHNALPFAVNDGGMVYLEVEDNRLDSKMLRKDGTVFDQFTIMKDVNTSKTVAATSSQPVTLSASWVGEYLWSTGEITRSITVNPFTSSTYQVIDPRNCLTDVFSVDVEAIASSSSTSLNLGGEPLQVYPNPVQRGTNLIINSAWPEPVEVFVTDMAGRVLLTQTLKGNASLNTSALPEEMYILNTTSKKPSKKHKFIVVEKY
ncbi:metallophosphoesterase [Rufibacter sp. DG15C]|uniref:metallophosphoesterase n=1 Tax=Rufibacter sp. DG15C TaxID=1379909 RepID=UPI000833A185|nr:metallophosphoesterase [Rufibacter sp. DG15C]